ncbi:MAG: DUF2384 domain-containing protein [Betaproteobacteria bacterium]|nr:DUF2384 domain-containing protein [Betaproteobacteria bacterium]MDE2622928.1 DUF2384 domain-containing protein [Betaproteobacteria bacterium]
MPQTHSENPADVPITLGKAVARAAERLAISHDKLARILGVGLEIVVQLGINGLGHSESSEEWGRALLFLKLYRSLDSIVGDDETARQWLMSENQGLGGRPIDLIQEPDELAKVVRYLEASTGCA